ncbi:MULTISPECIES: 2-oxoglutarate dehydrogenase, E2 component, dihydrolipoamide succinyltransferase [unclassified Agrococcus]|uniref:2-oxoglutarate dehydrogenase, E2 component, dihydrolipoamide succinyltransferase n=1 Tax=unclassified Agrococcus TaxID=2615065 RepID=UPI00361A4D9D
MADITLPALGESVTEGTITRWLKQVGDTVEVDEPLVEISTDKVDTEVPSPIAGTITEILADEDDTVDVGAVIARVGDASDAAADDAPAEEPAAEEEAPAAESGTTSEAETSEPEAPSTESPEPAAAPEAGTSDAGGDATDITLPALGESVTEGTITRWLKQVGDTVEVDEPLVEISTDKVDTEVPSPVAGTISEILANEDDTVDVGAVIARVGGSAGGSGSSDAPAEEAPAAEPEQEEPKQEAEPAQAPAPVQDIPPAPKAPEAPKQEAPKQEAPKQEAPKQEAPKQEAPKQEAPAAPRAQAPAAPATSSASVYVTPIVRKLAHERGVDLASVQGTGVGGRIRKEDVLSAATAAPAAAESAPAAASASAPIEDSPLRGTTAKMSRLRKVVAKRAVESMQTTAQLTTVVEVDVTKVAQLRDRVKGRFLETTGQKLSFLPFFSLAAVEALRAHPIINATDDGEEITYPAGEHLSMAVDTERGLLTPVIKDAGKLDLRGFAEQIADLASRTRDNKLGPDELAGGTFTLTNTGSRGALFDTPVVFQPQRAILGVGTVVKRPVVVSVDGQDSIAVRSMVYLALSYDHRIIDGADAARYLTQVKQRLEGGDFEGQLGI